MLLSAVSDFEISDFLYYRGFFNIWSRYNYKPKKYPSMGIH